jgi:hypothetical protein
MAVGIGLNGNGTGEGGRTKHRSGVIFDASSTFVRAPERTDK